MGLIGDLQKAKVTSGVKDNLKALFSHAKEQCDGFEVEIKNNLRKGKTFDHMDVPVRNIVLCKKECFAVSETMPVDMEDINTLFANIFPNDKSDINGICNIINSAFIAMSQGNKNQEGILEMYTVATEYPAIIRNDFKFWYRNTSEETALGDIRSVFAVTATKAHVDTHKLSFHEFIPLYLPVLSKAFNNDKIEIMKSIDRAREIFDLVNPGPSRLASTYNLSTIEGFLKQMPEVRAEPFLLTSWPTTTEQA